jgi:hypothetical protein
LGEKDTDCPVSRSGEDPRDRQCGQQVRGTQERPAFGGRQLGEHAVLVALYLGLHPAPDTASGRGDRQRQAVSFHFIDYVVHSWDVAKALGLEVHFAPELLDAALRVAEAVPNGETRLAPGSAFAPAVAWQDGSPLDRIVAILGRSPDWKRPWLGGPNGGISFGERDGDVEAAVLAGGSGNTGTVRVGDGADDRETEPVHAGALGPLGP